MAYAIWYSGRFKRQYRQLAKSGNPRILIELDKIIGWLAAGAVLPIKNRNHKLTGDLREFWECHAAPDWLLIYRYRHDYLVLELAATGTHSSLF